jgi:hypothetical protein
MTIPFAVTAPLVAWYRDLVDQLARRAKDIPLDEDLGDRILEVIAHVFIGADDPDQLALAVVFASPSRQQVYDELTFETDEETQASAELMMTIATEALHRDVLAKARPVRN